MPTATARQIKETAALSRRRHRQRTGTFVVEGVRSVTSALDAGARFDSVFVSPGADLPAGLLDRLGAAASIFDTGERDMARMSDVTTPPGILAVVRIPAPAPSDAPPARTLFLDGIQDPGNVGTLIRTAAWMGVDAVVAGPGTADPYAPKVVRSTMGGLWDVRIEQVDDAAAWLTSLAAAGASTWVADFGGVPADEWHPSTPAVLVIGSEANGPSNAVSSVCEGVVSIPARAGRAGVESLNAAVAGAILMSRWNAPAKP